MPPSSEKNAVARGIVTLPADAIPFVRGVSPAMCALERVIADVAPTDVPIMLVGESGTGKEVVALEIYRRSGKSNGPLVKCNCPALAPDSLKSYFCYGAVAGQELTARSGTIFFDDIGRLDAPNQSLVLQFLSDNGSTLPKHYDRVISSTSGNLEDEMRAGRFRQELFYRITGVCLRLPSLRQRYEDVPILLDHFLKKYSSLFERVVPSLSSSAVELLHQHPWPGNVRELENFARKLVILGDEELALSDLVNSRSSDVRAAAHRSTAVDNHKTRSLKAAAREASRKVERQMILSSLERTHWNRKRTARELQISYKALLYKLKQLEIDATSDLVH